MSEASAPMVTVIINCYNMRDYIEQCLRSVAAQRTSFEVEAIICDDCSPDGTQDVIRALAPSLPSNWTYLLYEKNSGDGGASMGKESTARARGKYLAVLDGDDYWTYDGKLQEQVDFLEAHPDFSAAFHHCEVVDKDGIPSGVGYPECPRDEYTFKEFFYTAEKNVVSCLLKGGHRNYQTFRSQLKLLSYGAYALCPLSAGNLVSLCRRHYSVEAVMPQVLVHLNVLGSRFMAYIHQLYDLEKFLSSGKIAFHHLPPAFRHGLCRLCVSVSGKVHYAKRVVYQIEVYSPGLSRIGADPCKALSPGKKVEK